MCSLSIVVFSIDRLSRAERLSYARIMYAFYIALASSIGESCRGERRGTVMLSLCIVLTLFIIQTGPDKQKSTIIHE